MSQKIYLFKLRFSWGGPLKQRGLNDYVKEIVENGALTSPRLHSSMEDELFSIVILTHAI